MATLIRYVLIVALLCPLSAPAANPPDLLNFAKRPDFRAPSVSPDGKYLAVIVGRKGRDVLRAMHIKTMKVTAEVSVREAPDILDYAWTGDDRIVASFGYRSTASSSDSNLGGEIFAINVNKSDSVYLFGNQRGYEFASGDEVRRGRRSRGGIAGVIDALVDDPRYAILAVHEIQGFWKRRISTQVYKVDVYSGKRVSEMFVPEGTFEFLLDSDGQIRVASGLDEHFEIVVYYRAVGDSDFKRLDALSGPGMRHHPAAFDDSDNAIYFAWGNDTSATGIAKYMPSTDEIETLWKGRDFDVYETLLDEDGAKAVATTFYSDKRHYVYFDKKDRWSRFLASIQHLFPDDDVAIENFSRDQGFAVIAVGSAGKPDDYYLADVESLHIEHLFNSRAAISEESLGVAEHFEIESRDGTTMRGYVIYPPGEVRKDLPMVVQTYTEMLSTRHYNRFDPDVQIFSSRGYAVLHVNHRGSAGYGQPFKEAGFRNWGTTVQDDITDAVRWAIDRGVADPDRICIAGEAFGAYSALMSAAREPGLYACAIGYNGIYDLPLAFGADSLPNVKLLQDYVATIIGSDDAELARQSPINHVNDIRADLLIAYERFKRRSPTVQSKELMKALDRAGIDYEHHRVRQEYYGVIEDETRVAFYRRMLEFVAASIGTPATVPEPASSSRQE